MGLKHQYSQQVHGEVLEKERNIDDLTQRMVATPDVFKTMTNQQLEDRLLTMYERYHDKIPLNLPLEQQDVETLPQKLLSIHYNNPGNFRLNRVPCFQDRIPFISISEIRSSLSRNSDKRHKQLEEVVNSTIFKEMFRLGPNDLDDLEPKAWWPVKYY